jgi:competence protein ComEC
VGRGIIFRITCLDVGQGTATLLEYPSGFRVLIDGGGSSFTATTVGERIIAPFLWKKGIRRIDAIAITHPDADHYNGLEFIVRHFSPKTLWVRDTEGHDENFKRLIQLAEQQNIGLCIPGAGDNLLGGQESLVCVTNLADRKNGLGNNGSRDSDNIGLILKACAKQLCALFPGDIGKNEERSLVIQGFDVQADILLSPHHGSITSNSSQFLAAVGPQHLLVSAGRSAKGYFPHKGLAKECANQQIALFTTSDQGTLQVIAKEDGYQLYGYTRKDDNPLFSYLPVLLDEKTFTPQ